MPDIAKAKRNVARMIDGGASEQEIDSYLSSEGLSAEALRSGGKRTLMQDVAGAAANFNKMIPFADEIAAAGAIPGDLISGRSNLGNAWQNARQDQRELDQTFNQAHPAVAALSRGVGLAANAAIPIGGGAVAGGSTLGNAARGAVIAGNQAALSSFADEGSFGERLGNASRASVDPVTLGIGAAFGALANRGSRRGKPVPLEELQRMKTQAYDDVENSGVRYSQQAYDDFMNDLKATAKAERISKRTAPKASTVLRDFEKNPLTNPTLGDIEQLRKIVNRDLTNARDPTDQYFGRLFKEKIDDLVENTPTSNMIAGTSTDGFEDVARARALNTRYRKTKAVEDALAEVEQAASATGSPNIDSNLRQAMRRVMNKTKGLTDEERQAFDKVIRGTPGQEFLRRFGKLAPQNPLMAQLGIGATIANPLFGGVMVGAGAAKAASDMMTRAHIRNLQRVISQGAQQSNPASDAIRRLLMFKAAQQVGANRGNKEKKQ